MNLNHFFYDLLQSEFGLSDTSAQLLSTGIKLVLVLLIAYIFYKILSTVGERVTASLAKKSKTEFDDYLIKNRAFSYFSFIILFLIIDVAFPFVFLDFPTFEHYAQKIITVLLIINVIRFVRSILKTVKDYLKTLPLFADKPIESYVQVFMIILWVFGIIIIFSVISGRSLWEFFTALGAISAVLILVFKDTILGFVASIQVSVNDTVRIGDWITMEKYGADGDVIEISLSSVKIRNFDKTITTLPTYYLISDSFKNWRGMSESGGRRIKRYLLIKSTSIRFLNDDEVKEISKIELLKPFIDIRKPEIDQHNQEKAVDKSLAINGRNLTNFGLFRKYVDEYIANHPQVNKDMLFMSRQLQQTPHGIPLEVYAFSSDKRWPFYERIMANIFDHLMASIPYFKLELYEYPSGSDLKFDQLKGKDLKNKS
ncbi:MAG: mechanosensitive ion channel [Psychroflexus sp.]|nr:mechanosensitive ion channel [Psychroflexus sp.]